MPRDAIPQFRVKSRQTAHLDMEALLKGEVLPSVIVFPPTLSTILEEILQKDDYLSRLNRREHYAADVLQRFKQHQSVQDIPPNELPSDEEIRVHTAHLKGKIKQQRQLQNSLPPHVVKLLEEWIEEDRSATKEPLLERIKQLPPPPPLVQSPVHELVENNGNGGADAAASDEGGGQDGQPEQQHEQQDQLWSLPADEIVLQKIQDIHDAVMT
jgi:hypothetical protein